MGVSVNNYINDCDAWVSPNIRAYQIGSCTGDAAAVLAFKRLCFVGQFGYGRAWYDEDSGRHMRLLRADVLHYMESLPWGALIRAYWSAGNTPVDAMGEDEYHALIEMVSRLSARAYAVTDGGRL